MDLTPACDLIRRGEIVGMPTETVYGLAANALDPAAVERIYAAKGRPKSSPLIVHVDSVDMAKSLVTVWPREAQALAQRFWPGPLTIVLPKRKIVPDLVTAGLSTVGIRMPAHPVAAALIRECGLPLAAPSANRFTELSPTTAQHVRDSLGPAVTLVLDGGPCTVGIESTVVSLAGQKPVLLRPGMISREQIEAVIGPLADHARSAGADPSPGLHHKHYSPKTPLILADSPPAEGNGVWLFLAHPKEGCRNLPMPSCPDQYAAALYEKLHQLDRERLDWIAVERPPATAQWAAILDRLTRAASTGANP
jgi:L-threonylcarbamoyladenylate synthase